jgi:hypothetical protein
MYKLEKGERGGGIKGYLDVTLFDRTWDERYGIFAAILRGLEDILLNCRKS